MTNTAIVISALGLLGLGMAGMLVLYLCLRQELRRNIQKQILRLDELSEKIRTDLEARSDSASLAASKPNGPGQAVPRALTPAQNINPHIRARRLLRQGENPANMAPAIGQILGLSRREAELYARVQQLRFQRPSRAENHSSGSTRECIYEVF